MSISIGHVRLDSFEVPSVIQYGGTQRIVTHYLGDGTRVSEVLGPEEMDIRFNGTISGPEAVRRALTLDNMRKEGARTTLQWSSFRIPIIIRQFMAEYQSDSWIIYSISCTVVETYEQLSGALAEYTRLPRKSDIAALSSVDGIDMESLLAAFSKIQSLGSNPRNSEIPALIEDDLDSVILMIGNAISRIERGLIVVDSTTHSSLNMSDEAELRKHLAYALRIHSTLRAIATEIRLDVLK